MHMWAYSIDSRPLICPMKLDDVDLFISTDSFVDE